MTKAVTKCGYFNPMYMYSKCSSCADWIGCTCFRCGRCSTCHYEREREPWLGKAFLLMFAMAVIFTLIWFGGRL